MAKVISTNAVMMKLFGKTGLSESKKVKPTTGKFNADAYAEAYATIIADKYRMKAENYALRYYTKTKLARGESLEDIRDAVKNKTKDAWATIKYLIKKFIIFVKQLINKIMDLRPKLAQAVTAFITYGLKAVVYIGNVDYITISKRFIGRSRLYSLAGLKLTQNMGEAAREFFGKMKSIISSDVQKIAGNLQMLVNLFRNTQRGASEASGLNVLSDIMGMLDKSCRKFVDDAVEKTKDFKKEMKKIRTKGLKKESSDEISNIIKTCTTAAMGIAAVISGITIVSEAYSDVDYVKNKELDEDDKNDNDDDTPQGKLKLTPGALLTICGIGGIVSVICYASISTIQAFNKTLSELDLAISTRKSSAKGKEENYDELRDKIASATKSLALCNKQIRIISKEMIGLGNDMKTINVRKNGKLVEKQTGQPGQTK